MDDLDAYAAHFRDAFRRGDQARWAAVYLRGLLGDAERKTISGLARRVELPSNLAVKDAAQALQNFVNQSPWDEGCVGRRYRDLMAGRVADPDGVFVLDDPAFVKQGRHSVGVQRQYSAALGRKTNCQIAVALYQAGPVGCCPLALRLYLPRGWVQTPDRLKAAGVPDGRRRGQGKGTVALELLDEARAEGWPARRMTGGAGFGADKELRQGLADRGLTYRLEAPGDAEPLPGEVMQLADGGRVWLSNDADADAGVASDARHAAAAAAAVLTREFGLGHFEGRSWRGFHHHAGLVLLAYGFRFFPGGRAALADRLVEQFADVGPGLLAEALVDGPKRRRTPRRVEAGPCGEEAVRLLPEAAVALVGPADDERGAVAEDEAQAVELARRAGLEVRDLVIPDQRVGH
jgi:SRSO17 transposase